MSLKTKDDWPIRQLGRDPFETWTHYDKSSGLYIPNENGVASHFSPTLQSFGLGESFKLSRNSCNIFQNNGRRPVCRNKI
jgi:hypothetical protein